MSVMKICYIMFVTRNEYFVGFLLPWIIASIHLGRDVYKSFTGMSAFLSGWTLKNLLMNSSLSSDYICSMIYDWAGWSFNMVMSLSNHTIYGLGALLWWKISLFFKFDIKSFFNSYSSYDKFQPSWTITLCIPKVPLLLFSSCHISLSSWSFDKFSVIEMQLHSIFILFQIFASHNLVFTLNAFYLMLLPSWNAPLYTPK